MQNKKSSLCINALTEGENRMQQRYRDYLYADNRLFFPPIENVIPQVWEHKSQGQ